MLVDRYRLGRSLARLDRLPAPEAARLRQKLVRSAGLAARRRQAVPAVRLNDTLPVYERAEEIRQAIANHQLIVLSGETGSGKTTQIPQICLQLGRGIVGAIGHTQPRRIAARSVAARIAEELGVPLGAQVGYKIRFADKISDQTMVKLMTDGILLAETQTDPLLSQYDTIIIDEAHERSLNIDFLLGYLKQLLPRRPDLKVIITSATIDAEHFARHFGNVPVIEVSGRTYPVEVRYRPVVDEDAEGEGEGDGDVAGAIVAAVDELTATGNGDILVFLPGEREIREAQDALAKHVSPHITVLPLYARLSAQDQEQIFRPPGAGRRIVLATNVAETSLTVPGIRFVIDTGLARVKRYSYRSKVERLHIEKISQAAARQRAGRCGRVAAGVCIRLYAEDDFTTRAPYTDPEIRRSNLAGVILRMKALKLGDIADFPFLDKPDSRYISDGYRILEELGAVDADGRLTPLGGQLAALPLDPKVGRMLLAAQKENCLREVLVLVAALSVQDPRERPQDQLARATQLHARFRDEQSDFMGWLKLWAFHEEELARKRSRRKHAAFLKANFLSVNRMREWRDIHQQLQQMLIEMGYRPNEVPAGYAEIHRALLTGLLGNIGLKGDGPEYLGARGMKLHIFPGSALHKKGPRWIMAAEIVDTSRVYARTVARIDPEWIEPLAAHLVKKSYFDPHWEKRPAQAAAYERVILYGLPIVAKRRIPLASVDRTQARELFIREGLVAGDFHTRAPFLAHNQALVAHIESLEHKARRQDILVDEETIFAIYDARIPADVVDGASFERWRKAAEREDPKRLYLSESDLVRRAAAVPETDFPEAVDLAGNRYSLSYRFTPGTPTDGVTMEVPLPALNQLPVARTSWLVPGLREEKVQALIRGLPQSLRRHFVPVPEFARRALAQMQPSDVPIEHALGEALFRLTGVRVPEEAWNPGALPEHLKMILKVVDPDGTELAASRDYPALQQAFRDEAEASFSAFPKSEWEQSGLTRWTVADLPDCVEFQQQGNFYTGYPALVDEGGTVGVRLFDTPEAAIISHREGLRRLFVLALPDQVRYLARQGPLTPALKLQYAFLGTADELIASFTALVLDETFLQGREIRSAEAFEAALAAGRPQLMATAQRLGRLVAEILGALHPVRMRLKDDGAKLPKLSREDLESQLAALAFPNFLAEVGMDQLRHYPRYLKAVQIRLDKIAAGPAREETLRQTIAPYWKAYLELRGGLEQAGKPLAGLAPLRWMVEELRVSLYAQELKTPFPVSTKRLDKLLAELKI